MSRRARACTVAATALTLAALAACGEPPGDASGDVASAALSTVTFRLWDEATADAYRESFDAFNAIHPGLHVDVEVVPRESYADQVASDLAAGTMADIFWLPSDAITAHAHAGDLIELGETLGTDHEEWEPALTALYTRDEELWAVPQLWDATVVYYNTDLVERAEVDPTALTWDPAAVRDPVPVAAPAPTDGPRTPADDATEPTGPGHAQSSTDTLRRAVRELTRDAEGRAATDDDFDAGAVVEYGINTDLTAPAVWLPFLAQLGGAPDDAAELDLTGPESRAAFGYLTELPAAPADDADVSARQLFTSGRLALYQSTSADMRHVAAHAQVDWGLAPVAAGPRGSVTVADGVAAAANAASGDPEATAEVLRWLASTDGQSSLASHGIGVPAAEGAQDLYRRVWADRGVDAAAALDVPAVTIASGPHTERVLGAVRPALAEMFRGEVGVVEALDAAQGAAEDARAAFE